MGETVFRLTVGTAGDSGIIKAAGGEDGRGISVIRLFWTLFSSRVCDAGVASVCLSFKSEAASLVTAAKDCLSWSWSTIGAAAPSEFGDAPSDE